MYIYTHKHRRNVYFGFLSQKISFKSVIQALNPDNFASKMVFEWRNWIVAPTVDCVDNLDTF